MKKELEENKTLMAELIMKGVHASGDEMQFWIDKVKYFIDSLCLSNRKCSVCNMEMSFFNWHMAQGACDVCNDLTLKRMRDEGYGDT